MFTINLVISASPEFLSVLRGLISPKAEAAAPAEEKTQTSSTRRVKTVNVEAPAATEAVPETKEEGPKEEAPKVTFEQIRDIVQTKNQAGKKAQIKEILAEFGAGRVTEVKTEQYNEFHAKVAAL